MLPLIQRRQRYARGSVPEEFQWLKVRMDFTTGLALFAATGIISGLFWIGGILNKLQTDSLTGGIRDTAQDKAIETLIRREEVDRAMLQTIITKLTLLESRIHSGPKR